MAQQNKAVKGARSASHLAGVNADKGELALDGTEQHVGAASSGSPPWLVRHEAAGIPPRPPVAPDYSHHLPCWPFLPAADRIPIVLPRSHLHSKCISLSGGFFAGFRAAPGPVISETLPLRSLTITQHKGGAFY